MSIDLEYLQVPKGDTRVYDQAEKYFVARLTAHFRPQGYDCFREYEYAGGSTFKPTSPTLTHADPQKALILRMLQGGDGADGFRFLTPRVVDGALKERGFQKPDFVAFRAHAGVVGEVGTANMRDEKLRQLSARVVDLQRLADEEHRVQILKAAGRPVAWSGMRWRAADYHPEEGPVLIPVDDDRVISTEPTFEPKVDGLYLYQLLRYRRHGLREPVTLPRLTPGAQQQLRDAWRRYQQASGPGGVPRPGGAGAPQPGWLDGWPALRRELLQGAAMVGVAAVVVAAVAVVVASLGVAAGGALVAGFAALLAIALEGTPRATLG
jgi:hypothetical protein